MATPRGGPPVDYLLERFEKFLTNDWIHLERKVAALDAKMGLVIAMLSVLVGLMVYAVVK